MTLEQGAWVYDNVFPYRIRRANTPPTSTLYTVCRCQFGISGDCRQGEHGRCVHDDGRHHWDSLLYGSGRSPVWWPELQDRGEGPRRYVVQVWRAGSGCRWRCPCGCHTAKPRHEQLDLFAVVSDG